jgi:hypothetical protein
VEAIPQSIHIESQNKKSFGGSLHRLHLLHFILHRLHLFVLYLNSPLLATFYTLSFIDYIHDATHLLTLLTLLKLLTLLTYINLLNLQYMCVCVCVCVCVKSSVIMMVHNPSTSKYSKICRRSSSLAFISAGDGACRKRLRSTLAVGLFCTYIRSLLHLY